MLLLNTQMPKYQIPNTHITNRKTKTVQKVSKKHSEKKEITPHVPAKGFAVTSSSSWTVFVPMNA